MRSSAAASGDVGTRISQKTKGYARTIFKAGRQPGWSRPAEGVSGLYQEACASAAGLVDFAESYCCALMNYG